MTPIQKAIAQIEADVKFSLNDTGAYSMGKRDAWLLTAHRLRKLLPEEEKFAESAHNTGKYYGWNDPERKTFPDYYSQFKTQNDDKEKNPTFI